MKNSSWRYAVVPNGGVFMNFESSRTGMKPVFLRGGKDVINIEKHDKKQLKIDENWYQVLLHEHPDLLLTEKFDFEYEPISIGMDHRRQRARRGAHEALDGRGPQVAHGEALFYACGNRIT